MHDVATLNDRSAPVRRDLTGEELVYELVLLLDRLQVGDTLRIRRKFLWQAGVSLENVLPPNYPHERWSDVETTDLCVKRIG